MTTWHAQWFEVWPRDMPAGCSYPIPLPEHVTLYVREGAYVFPTVDNNHIALRTGHDRYKCNPPCKGTT